VCVASWRGERNGTVAGLFKIDLPIVPAVILAIASSSNAGQTREGEDATIPAL
jgi:hypothetical protein